jgi:hypothetical protein
MSEGSDRGPAVGDDPGERRERGAEDTPAPSQEPASRADERGGEGDQGRQVMSNLPRSRPQRRSTRRDPRAQSRAAGAARRAAPRRAKQRPAPAPPSRRKAPAELPEPVEPKPQSLPRAGLGVAASAARIPLALTAAVTKRAAKTIARGRLG